MVLGDEKKVSSTEKNIKNSRLERKNHSTKIAKTWIPYIYISNQKG